MVTTIAGRGTDEAAWRQWDAPDGWPRLDLRTVARAVVVGPHPDDEVLGAGGLMALLAQQGSAVVVVAVTDGEASHPGSARTDGLAARRTDESLQALTELGVDPANRLRLRVPDGGIAADEGRVADEIAALLQPGDIVVATWRDDGHPDHEATGRAAALACGRVGGRLLQYPVWTWHWAAPGDSRVPWDHAARVDLPTDVVAAKRRAMACFASQVEPLGDRPEDAPILPAHVLDRFGRDWETFLR
jgi:LmbE family N-acetylglucosaminyl deacetylase